LARAGALPSQEELVKTTPFPLLRRLLQQLAEKQSVLNSIVSAQQSNSAAAAASSSAIATALSQPSQPMSSPAMLRERSLRSELHALTVRAHHIMSDIIDEVTQQTWVDLAFHQYNALIISVLTLMSACVYIL